MGIKKGNRLLVHHAAGLIVISGQSPYRGSAGHGTQTSNYTLELIVVSKGRDLEFPAPGYHN